jgi:hypothetical protein
VKKIEKQQWEGCVIDRDQSNDALDTPPTSTDYKTLFPAADCRSLTTVLPLTNSWSTLHAKIDAMAASGNTNVTIGLAWGWHTLTANLPFTDAAEPAPDLDKVIVLLTDGDNTQNRWTTQGSKIDARTSAACTNAKAAGIQIYAVRVIKATRRCCATAPPGRRCFMTCSRPINSTPRSARLPRRWRRCVSRNSPRRFHQVDPGRKSGWNSVISPAVQHGRSR